MRHTIIVTLLIALTYSAIAQDTLWVRVVDNKPLVTHVSLSNESVFVVAKKYAVPPAQLADVNNLGLQQAIVPGRKVLVPIDNYNYIKEGNVFKSKPLFYKVGSDDNLIVLSRLFKISQSFIQKWNGLPDTKLMPGKVLKVGWIAFDKSLEQQNAFKQPKDVSIQKTAIKPFLKDSAQKRKVVVTTTLDNNLDSLEGDEKPSAYELLYDQQTLSMNTTEESGAAVFYDLKMKAPKDVYYAFHNMAIKGTILKITNPANGKFVFAKVIGTIPNLKDYHNALLGLSNNAAGVLDARDSKMFCNIKYR